LVILTVGTCLLVSVTSVATANNHGDTNFSSNLSSVNKVYYTPQREKTDSTSCYMLCTSSPYYYMAKVYGKQRFGVKHDLSHGYTYKLKTGVKFYLRNWVYEEGYDYATIRCEKIDNHSYTIAGKWSPDSVRE